MQERSVFEYWSHAASILPMEDYSYSLFPRHAFRENSSSWFPKDPELEKNVLRRIEMEGPLRSRDFDSKKSGTSGWWNWKPAKKALERLFMEGRLDVSHRIGFDKVYDLPERILPDPVLQKVPTQEEYCRHLIFRTLQSHGLASLEEISYLRNRETSTCIRKEAAHLIEDGELIEVQLEGQGPLLLTRSETLKGAHSLPKGVKILSPFDNSVIHRAKLNRLFDFEYQIECYTPKAKRKFGYFTLPLLYRDRFIGRLDAKRDRKSRILHVLSCHFEEGIDPLRHQEELHSELQCFSQFQCCDKLSGFSQNLL